VALAFGLGSVVLANPTVLREAQPALAAIGHANDACVPLGIGTRGRYPVDILLPGCYQNFPYQDDLGRHPAIPDRFGR
jgi:hypothetical protein